MSEPLSVSELTYLELTAKHAPNELPQSAALVARLVDEIVSGDRMQEEIESLTDQLAEAQLAHRDDIKALQTEIEDLQEQLEQAETTIRDFTDLR